MIRNEVDNDLAIEYCKENSVSNDDLILKNLSADGRTL